MDDDKITIIEGPPPTFELPNQGWAYGVSDSSTLAGIALTKVRTFNGHVLVERCYKAWQKQQSIHLEFLTPDGLHQQAQIVAARNTKVTEGDLLMLWVRLPTENLELEIGYEDDDDDVANDDDLNMDIF
ncbi:MAG TPA: hypothetical protein VI451_01615 [Anaerolineales bacterium]|jgi:hypothetical protein|nr:hypothetical protein [Anaerolineales bacterium]